MNILITGAYGQLGSEIKELAKEYSSFTFFFTDVDTLDITNPNAVASFFAENNIDFVVNCAAYTRVDRAESEPEMAHQINAVAPGVLAENCKNFNAKLIHISTDYVFDGNAHSPYNENCKTNPLGVYGITKLEGEKNCLDAAADVVIIRTSWLYSAYGNNFVKTMLRLGNEKERLDVIFDQVGTPTNAADLASCILEIIAFSNKSNCNFAPGIYHYSNEGVCSWYDFALAIHEMAGVVCNVKPVLSSEFKTTAKRPFYSVLNKSKVKSTYKLEILHWRESLKKCINKIQKGK